MFESWHNEPLDDDDRSEGHNRSASLDFLEPVTEDHMVLAFLLAELESRRHVKYLIPPGTPIWRVLQIRGLILKPNLADEAENESRRRILAYRGYRMNAVLFPGFPEDVVWHRARLTIDELRSTKYAGHPTWVALSGQTRRVADGARNVGKIVPPGKDPTQDILDIAGLLQEGRSFSELIFLGEPGAPTSELVLLEGHSRATAYIYAADRSALTVDEIEVLVGVSPHIRGWGWFSKQA